ncbi:F-box/kelch-repeat protein At3g23880-like [Rhododendron vialii]|uniref:F-box/kelch-repeat protein At3g23880-like n=1 Tax=Rhododendron vialii TaxID=182163 RepID=UPI00265DD6A8|nr:F-box/kelch-repeat protein At3g23880-like [Rhododendron vialii]
MSDYIPYELTIEILARLPVVSLLRFKSACKSWYSLIVSPSFVTKHLNHRKYMHFIGLYNRDDQKERYFIFRDDEQCGHKCSELEFPYKVPSLYYSMIVGSCNGLLCMWEDSSWEESAIIVWNPSMRKLVTLPEPPSSGICALGFGAHPATHEYKVVRIVCQSYPYQHEFQPHVELYTQGTGSWRGLGSTFPLYCFIPYKASQAFVSGAVNWIAEDPRVSVGYQHLIVSFDMSTETFSTMMLPPALADRETRFLSVTLFRESLAMLCGQQRDKGDCSIWLMKEYGVPISWTKLFSFKLNQPVYPKRTLWFMKQNEVLVSTIDKRLLSYDIGTKASVDTGIRGLPSSFHVMNHNEVLLSTIDKRLLSYDIGTKASVDTRMWGFPSSFHVQPFVESLVVVENKNGVVDWQLNPL